MAVPFGPSANATGGREFGPHSKPADPGQASRTVDKPSGKTVTMVFPREVTLTTDSYKRIHWPAGVHQVPEELASHPYLEKSGVKKHSVDTARLPDLPPVDYGKALLLFKSHGYKTETVEEAQKLVEGFNLKDRESFLAELDDFEPASTDRFGIDELQKLTKAELVDLAKTKLNLELDPAEKKDDLILKISAEAEKTNAAGAGQQ